MKIKIESAHKRLSKEIRQNTCNKKNLNYIIHIAAKSVIRRGNLFIIKERKIKVAYATFFLPTV